MRFGAAHTPRRNMVKPIIAAMRESVKYKSYVVHSYYKANYSVRHFLSAC